MSHAILIDPFAREVTAVPLPPDGEMGRVVGPDYMDVVTLTRDEDGNSVCLAVDDTGLYRDNQRFWSFVFNPGQIFAGKGLLFGADEEGASVGLIVPAAEVAATVIWREVRFAGMTTREGMTYNELFGAEINTLTVTPNFEPES